MSTEAATDPTVLTPELIDRVRQLAPADKARLQLLLADYGEPEGTPEEIRRLQNEETWRRVDALVRGEMEVFTVEETMVYLRSRAWRTGPS